MLGTSQRYFESVAGIARESFGDEHRFRIQGCNITATIVDGSVSSLRLELGDTCQASSGSGLDYLADCLSGCDNSYDPSVYAYWQGPRAVDFTEVLLEAELTSDAAIEAASLWAEQMRQAQGDDYLFDTRFNCDRQYNGVASQAFALVTVTAVTVGSELRKPEC